MVKIPTDVKVTFVPKTNGGLINIHFITEYAKVVASQQPTPLKNKLKISADQFDKIATWLISHNMSFDLPKTASWLVGTGIVKRRIK